MKTGPGSQSPLKDSRDLAEFGYKQELNRTLGSFSSFAAGFSYISILTGMFQMFHLGFAAGGPAFFWTWPTVFLGQFLVALCFAELAGQYPLSGGVYQWSKHVGSRAIGWMTGWIYLACLIVTLAAVALALQTTLPQIGASFQMFGDGSDARDNAKNAVVLGCILIAFSTAINSVGVGLLARINNIGVFSELAGLFLLLILLALGADGKTLAVGGMGAGRMSGVVHIWDMDSGEEKQSLECPAWINAIAFAPGATVLGAACQDNTIRLWDLRTGAEAAKLNGHANLASALAFSPNGKFLASGSQDQSLVLWDLGHLRKQATLFGHSGPVMSLAYAPDGRTLASGGFSGEVFEWTATDQRAPTVLRGDEGPSLGQGLFQPVAFSPDGKLLAMSSGSRIILWNCQRMAKHLVLEESDKPAQPGINFGGKQMESLTFAPDGKTLASKRSNHVILWDVATGKKLKEYPLENGIGLWRISFTPDGQYIVSAGKLLELATGKIEPFLGDGTKFSLIAFAVDGQSMAGVVFSTTSPAWALTVYEGQNRRAKFAFKGPERPVVDLAFSGDGQLLVSAGDDGSVRVWNVAQGELQALCTGHQAKVRAVAISPDGQTIASASADGSVKLWDPITGQERLTLSHDGRIAVGIAFSPDGRMLAVGWGMDPKNPMSPGVVTVYHGPRP